MVCEYMKNGICNEPDCEGCEIAMDDIDEFDNIVSKVEIENNENSFAD